MLEIITTTVPHALAVDLATAADNVGPTSSRRLLYIMDKVTAAAKASPDATNSIEIRGGLVPNSHPLQADTVPGCRLSVSKGDRLAAVAALRALEDREFWAVLGSAGGSPNRGHHERVLDATYRARFWMTRCATGTDPNGDPFQVITE